MSHYMIEVHTPNWVKNAVFYQIYPDRFSHSPRMQHGPGLQFKPWGSPPEEQGFQGGDLYGIIDRLDYLQDLGVTALYLNPIFSAATNHRYNTYDYLQVDPLLGGNAALKELIDQVHQRGMRVVLDGVFNHCGRGFWAFHHILENGGTSPYIDWFTVQKFPLHPYPEAGQPANYAAWWNYAALPKFNTKNPGVREYLLYVARYWLEFGIDGWRLDVPEEIDDDDFWREFRRVVKGTNPEAYIVGEIWHTASRWLKGDMFDAVMNYQVTAPVLDFFGAADLYVEWRHPDVGLKPIQAEEFREQIESLFELYPWEINFAQLNMLDSHDMPRALWLLKEDQLALRQAVLCQMTLPGAPCVYYGDEVGLSAGGDPFCREAFPWHAPERWDLNLLKFYQAAIALRKTYPALRTGDFAIVHAEGKSVAYRRCLGDQEMLVAFNTGKRPKTVRLPSEQLAHCQYRQVWSPAAGETLLHAGSSLELNIPAQGTLVLAAEKHA